MLTVLTEKVEIEAGDVIECVIPHPWSEFHKKPYRKYVVLKVFANKTFLLASEGSIVPYPKPSAPHKYRIKEGTLVFLSAKEKEPELIRKIEKGAANSLVGQYKANIKILRKLEETVQATKQQDIYIELWDKMENILEVQDVIR